MDLDTLKFDDRGLIPAIVQDAETGKVLTLAYMNRESLSISLERGLTCFWSRSRQELWLKGETSGNYQHIVELRADCDRDALLVKVKKDKTLDQAVELDQDLKVVKCHYTEDFLREDSLISSLRKLFLSMLID